MSVTIRYRPPSLLLLQQGWWVGGVGVGGVGLDVSAAILREGPVRVARVGGQNKVWQHAWCGSASVLQGLWLLPGLPASCECKQARFLNQRLPTTFRSPVLTWSLTHWPVCPSLLCPSPALSCPTWWR